MKVPSSSNFVQVQFNPRAIELAYATPAIIERHRAGKIVPLIAWARSDAFLRRAKALGLERLPIACSCVDVHGQLAMAEQGLGIAIVLSLVGSGSSIIQPLSPARSIITS